jgi:biopolymer transport protein ExbD
MALKKKKRPPAEIPTASMSDIAFLLLIFFLTTTKFDNKIGIGLVLPPPPDPNAPEFHLDKNNMTRILIGRDGTTVLNIGASAQITPIDISQISSRVKQLISSNPKMVITIITDRRSNYSDMIKVLEQVRLAGAEKISLAAN